MHNAGHDCTHPNRDVSDDAIRVLKVRAAEARQPLETYLRFLIEREASRPTLAEAVERARRDAVSDITAADILSAVDDERAGR